MFTQIRRKRGAAQESEKEEEKENLSRVMTMR